MCDATGDDSSNAAKYNHLLYIKVKESAREALKIILKKLLVNKKPVNQLLVYMLNRIAVDIVIHSA